MTPSEYSDAKLDQFQPGQRVSADRGDYHVEGVVVAGDNDGLVNIVERDGSINGYAPEILSVIPAAQDQTLYSDTKLDQVAAVAKAAISNPGVWSVDVPQDAWRRLVRAVLYFTPVPMPKGDPEHERIFAAALTHISAMTPPENDPSPATIYGCWLNCVDIASHALRMASQSKQRTGHTGDARKAQEGK